MEAQQVQVYGHGHGHEIKTKKRPWPRFLVSCVALMLFLVVSWHFNTVFFFFPVLGIYWGHHIILQYHSYPVIPPFTHTSICLPVAPSLALQPRNHPSANRKTGTGLSSAHEDDAWHDLAETLLVRVQLRDLTIASS